MEHKDYLGHSVVEGDCVIAPIATSTSGRKLICGYIKSFCNRSGYDCAVVSYKWVGRYSKTAFDETKTMSTNKLVRVANEDPNFINTLY